MIINYLNIKLYIKLYKILNINIIILNLFILIKLLDFKKIYK